MEGERGQTAPEVVFGRGFPLLEPAVLASPFDSIQVGPATFSDIARYWEGGRPIVRVKHREK